MSTTLFRRRLGAGAAALALALLLGGCAGASTAPTAPEEGQEDVLSPDFTLANDGYLTIATYGSNPPVNIDNPDGTMSGIEGELLNSFAAKYGLELKLAPTTFASMILDVQQGRADMGLFVYWTEERAQTLYYSSALLDVPAVVFADKDFDYQGPESLDGRKVGAIVGQVWAELLQKEIGDDAVLFQNQAQAGQALLNGQVDGYITGLTQMYNAPLSEHQDEIAAHELNDGDWNMPGALLRNTGYNVVSCDNQELAHALDDHLNEMIDSGDWKQVFSALPSEFAVSEVAPPQQGCGS